jgi:hypothetical protein
MTITTRDALIDGLGNNNNRVLWDKVSLNGLTVSQYASLWRATGVPSQGAIPVAAALCTKALLGSLGFDNQVAPATSYLAHHSLLCLQANTNLEIHDRLAHIGGLVGNNTSVQPAAINLATLAVPVERIGDVNYSDVCWWLEWYTATGATASSATVAVTYNDNSTGNATLVSVGGTVGASSMRQIQSASNGLFIKAINSVTLSASTGTLGSIGVTATRQRAAMSVPIANKIELFDWAALGLPEIPNDSCLMGVLMATNTTSGLIKGQGKIIHG